MPNNLILSDVSPNGNIEAYVEQDDRVVYFYLNGSPESQFEVRSCWVRNIISAPDALNVSEMRAGIPPMLPRRHCRHPQGAAPFSDTDALRVVWFEEGDAAALLAGNEILAIIPAWSEQEGFSGYARDCVGESDLCWELFGPTDNALHGRVARAEAFWKAWDTEPTPWPDLQDVLCEAYESQVGVSDKYYAIDGGEWPPKAMLRIPQSGCRVFVTIGVCIRPQPRVEMSTEEPEQVRRIELGLCLADDISEDVQQAAMRYLSGQTAFPWQVYTWLGNLHTLPCSVFANSRGEPAFTAVMLMTDPYGAPPVTMPKYQNDPVTVLWMIPITEAERKLAVSKGGKVLTERLIAEGYGWMHRRRPQVHLD